MTEEEKGISSMLLEKAARPFSEMEAFVWYCLNGYSGDDENIAKEWGVSLELLEEWLIDFGIHRSVNRKDAPTIFLRDDMIQSYDHIDIASIPRQQWTDAFDTKKDSEGNDISEDNISFVGFQMWIRTYCPYCSNPKNMKQLTYTNFTKLKDVYLFTSKEIRDVMLQIENRRDLRKRYTDLYASLLNWLKNDYGDRRTK